MRSLLWLLPWIAAAAPRPLTLVQPTLHQYEGGPPLAPGYEFYAGDTVFFAARVAGYKADEDAKVNLTYEAEALDPQGRRLAPPAGGTVEVELAPEDKNWLPLLRGSFLVPPTAASGAYRIVVRVKDHIGQRDTTGEFPFPVKGRTVEPSDVIVARNFRFLRREEDRDPMPQPVYRPGESVWGRFEMTGYALGEQNRVDVNYGLVVHNAAGKEMFRLDEAAFERDESFYPKRYVSGILNLTTSEDMAKGEYTITLIVRDAVGGKTSESRHVFRIE